MNEINKTQQQFTAGQLDKPQFIQTMYVAHHAVLFDYAAYLKQTNIKKIEIEDDSIIMTTRDRGVRMACAQGDFRIAPIETLNFFDYEKSESMMMENLINDGDTFFDIGANVGWYSINIAAKYRHTKVYAFEPIPTTYQQLEKNISLNAVPNIKTHHFGFSNTAGEFPFYYYPEGSGNASSANLTGRKDVETVQCQVRTLDEYIADNNTNIDFIKCDVEGAELLVFKGGEKTISRDKPIVFSEILRKWSAKFNYNPNEIFEFFQQLGYQAFTVSGSHLAKFEVMDDNTVETNFFFLHTVKHADLMKRYQV